MELEGAIKMICETESVGANNFRKRDIVITTNEQYPQHIVVQFVQDKCDILDNFKIGQNVKININIRGREWVSPQGETKYFNTIQGWQINFASGGNNAGQPPIAPQEHFETIDDINLEDDGDLPF